MSALRQALVDAGGELAESIGLDSCTEVGVREGAPRGLKGAHIALIGDSINVQLLLQGTDTSNLALARAMLGMEEDEELSEEDAAECVCELANQLAGCVQRRAKQLGDLKIGLPVFVNGDVESTQSQVTTTTDVTFGEVPVSLVLVSPSND